MELTKTAVGRGARSLWRTLPEPLRRRIWLEVNARRHPGALEPSPSSWPTDFNLLLHSLRGRALSQEPGGAEVVVSGGAPDETYLQWFGDKYPTPPKRHILVEKFRDVQEDLPAGVEFVKGSLGDMPGIQERSVDLIFAGQISEHLWADDLADFLIASHRVLRTGGRLVIDSPNRLVTLATGWRMPEHTLELTPSEIRELMALAGFDVESLEGLWLCIDPVTGTVLPYESSESPPLWPVDDRVDAAPSDPDHSFIWWLRAVRADRTCQEEAVRRRTAELFSTFRRELFGRLIRTVGARDFVFGGLPAVMRDAGTPGIFMFGPSVALPGGEQSATFTFVPPTGGAAASSRGSWWVPTRRRNVGVGVGEDGDEEIAAVVEVSTGLEQTIVGRQKVRLRDLPHHREVVRITVPFSLLDTTFNGETRVATTGVVPIGVLRGVEITEGAASPRIERVAAQRGIPWVHRGQN